MVLKSQSVTGPIVESVLTSLDTFFQSGIITENSINVQHSLSVLLESVSRCRFEATDRSQDEVVLVHMLELLRLMISLPIGNVLSDKDIWNIFDTVFINSQEVRFWLFFTVGWVFSTSSQSGRACSSRHYHYYLPPLFLFLLTKSTSRAASPDS